jgi:hypothetical protein
MGRSDLDAGLWEHGRLAMPMLKRWYPKAVAFGIQMGGPYERHWNRERSSRVVKLVDHLQRFLEHRGTPRAFSNTVDAVRHACLYHLQAIIIDMPMRQTKGMYTIA